MLKGGRGVVLDGLSRDAWGSVAEGDLVVADSDGCVVVPAAVEDEVVGKAMEKVSGEDTMRDVLRKGANLREVFKEYGIL